MNAVNVSTARANLYRLIDDIAISHVPVHIVGRRNNAVLLSEENWRALEETLYLNSIPGMAESILGGGETPLEDCIPADQVNWDEDLV